MQKLVKEAQHLHGQKARKGICSHIFLWNVSLAFHELIRPNLMHFPISITFSIISTFQFFDSDNFADNLTNANLSAFDNFFPIYRWPLVLTLLCRARVAIYQIFWTKHIFQTKLWFCKTMFSQDLYPNFNILSWIYPLYLWCFVTPCWAECKSTKW